MDPDPDPDPGPGYKSYTQRIRQSAPLKHDQRSLSFENGCVCVILLVYWSFVSVMEPSERESIKAASEDVSRNFKSLIDANDVESLKQLQHLISGGFYAPCLVLWTHKWTLQIASRLGRLQDSNAVLAHFNDYSEQCYAAVAGSLAKNAHLMKSMKSDLDSIFQKLRSMKAKISETYPDAFSDDSASKILDKRPDLEIPQ